MRPSLYYRLTVRASYILDLLVSIGRILMRFGGCLRHMFARATNACTLVDPIDRVFELPRRDSRPRLILAGCASELDHPTDVVALNAEPVGVRHLIEQCEFVISIEIVEVDRLKTI